jgi:prepilin peptidase CpaA
MHVPSPHHVVLVLLCAALVAVATTDVRHRKIPNGLVGAIAVAGVAHATALGGARGAIASLLGAALGIALLLWQFRSGFMGGGDVKLLGALGSWAGPLGVLYIFVLGSALSGILAVVSLLRLTKEERREVGANLLMFAREGQLTLPEPRDLARSRGIPFGVALAVAGAGVVSVTVGR